MATCAKPSACRPRRTPPALPTNRPSSSARANAQAIAQETRDSIKADIAGKRTAVEADLAAKVQSAEASIAASKLTAMGNVSAIAAETAHALVERLSGSASMAEATAAVNSVAGGGSMNFGMDATSAATVWATIGLVIFIAIALYMGVPKMITGMLDKRIKQVEDELAEAERLRSEARALLDGYAKRRVEAEREAEGIVLAAREEAFRLTEEATAQLDTLIARRTKAVEDKIAQAEAQAVAEVRDRSADLAVEAARLMLQNQMGQRGSQLVDQAIKDVAARLN